MEGRALDLFNAESWSFIALAVAAVVVQQHGGVRRWVLALVNFGLFAFLLGLDSGYVLGGVLAAWLVLRAIGWCRPVWLPATLGGLSVVGLFVGYKLSRAGWDVGLVRVNFFLATVGFSYVALRLLEVGRAVAEGRHAPPDLASTINYLLPFHMISAGPIQSYDDFVAQPAVPPPPGPADALAGFERIATGLFKKFVLANLIEKVFLTGFRSHGAYSLVEMDLNFLWLYLDFSAYSDVAVGLGRLMGVATPENFDRPYLARNPIDFWDRWHISLSQFIRRNVFIPIQLGLMRRTGGGRPLLIAGVAFTASFLLCGLWHNFMISWLAWGVYQSAGLIACNAYKDFLVRRLGRKGLKRYMANRWYRALAVFLTYQFSAGAVILVTPGLVGQLFERFKTGFYP